MTVERPVAAHGDSYGLLGAHLIGSQPIRRLEIALRPGLTALYGKNGVGKTQLLERLSEVFSESVYLAPRVSDGPGTEASKPNLRAAASPTIATYFNSGLHYRWPLSRDLWDNDTYRSPIAEALDAAVKTASRERHPPDALAIFMDWGDGPPPSPCEWDEVVLLVMERIGLDVEVEDVEYLLGEGRWMVGCEPYAPAYLCDPRPTDGPLSGYWTADRTNWNVILDIGEYDRDWLGPLDAVWGDQVVEPYFASEPPLQFPPLPGQLGQAEHPAWFAYPIACVVALDDFNPVGKVIKEAPDEDLQVRTAQSVPFLNEDKSPLVGPEIYPPRHFAGSTLDALDRLRDHANRLLAMLFDEPPLLSVRVTHPMDWFIGKPSIEWSATTEMSESSFSIDRLGSAHCRYSKFAIQRALSGLPSIDRPGLGVRDSNGPRPTFALIDEPESALHPAAERQVAEGLKSLADYVIVATHSTVVIDSADDIVHLTRNDGGNVQVQRLSVDLTPAQRQMEARRLGQTPGTLASLVRVILLVEGGMDQSVISAFLKPEIMSARVQLLPLHGTNELSALPSADYLFNSTDAKVVVCLDNTDAKVINNLKTQLSKTNDDAAQRSILYRARDSAEFAKSPEMKKLADLLEAACTAHRLDRIEVFGFKKRDIVHYLNVELIKADAVSWDQLWADFVAQSRAPIGIGSGAAFKKFVGKGYTVRGVDEAIDRMSLELKSGQTLSSTRPVEFTRLAALLTELSRRKR